MGTEGDLTSGDKHTIPYTNDVSECDVHLKPV